MTTPVTQSVLRLNTFFATNNTNLTLIAKDLKYSFVSLFLPFVAKTKTLNSFLATNHTNLTLIAKHLKLLFVSTFVSLVAKENQIQEGLL